MKKTINLKRVMSLFAVIVLMFSIMTVTVSAGSVSDTKNSVVAVIGQNGTVYASGFAIGEKGKPVEYIVTSNQAVLGGVNTTATVAFDIAANDYVSADIYLYSAAKDIAILKLPQPTKKVQPAVLCLMEDVNPDDAFAAIAYPGNPNNSKAAITVTKGGIKKTDRVNSVDVYLLDLAIPSNSGGPLVNSAGEVVGINAANLIVADYAIVIDELLTVIDTNKIPVALHGDINWFLLIAGAIVLVIIILVVLLVSRKKNDTDYDNYTKPIDSGASATVPQQIQDTAKASARVIAIGGTLNGKRYSITAPVKVGRDSSKCAIAFPVNTQGVSAVHCEIAFDGAVCYVKDLNSSYGTYTIDGRKLTPNVPQILQSGEKFYLATPENTFEVRF